MSSKSSVKLATGSCGAKKAIVGYNSPTEASRGPREKWLYVTCLPAAGNPSRTPDYVATVDVDPQSPTFCQVIRRAYALQPDQEFHHSGWNTCSSCKHPEGRSRDKFIVPCLHSDCIYVFEVDRSDERNLKLYRVVRELAAYDLSAPHTVHCTPDGDVLVSCMGDAAGRAKGALLQLDGRTCEVKRVWSVDSAAFGYAFWYKPSWNVLITSEWGAPNAWRRGFRLPDLLDGQYGSSLSVYELSTGKKTQVLELGEAGSVPLEVKFMHEPLSEHGYVVCALGGSVFHVCRERDVKSGRPTLFQATPSNRTTEDGVSGDSKKSVMYRWTASAVIQLPSVQTLAFSESEVKAVLTDFIISMDDQWMYVSNWTHGDVLQYSLRDPFKPLLVSRLSVGGVFSSDSFSLLLPSPALAVVKGKSGASTAAVASAAQQTAQQAPTRPRVRGQVLRGGPQMLQLSLDGQRLYVNNSLHSKWDQQFYPDVYYQGAQLYLLQTGANDKPKTAGLKLDPDFLVDFGAENPPALAHEVRYPGGDCTSDIW
jgi:selenium-binding protein 1